MAESKNTQTLFLFPCECGLELRVPIGKAGLIVDCPHCGNDQLVSGLKELRRYRTIEKAPPPKSKFQFHIRAILLVTVIAAIVLGISNRISLEASLVIFGLPVLYCFVVLVVALAVHNVSDVTSWLWDKIQRK